MQDLIQKLFLAVSKAKTANILFYLKQGAPIDARDENGMTPLIKAAKLRNYVVQKLLLRNGANSHRKDWAPKCGCTALHYSASTGDVECIKLLLAYQAHVGATDKKGCTPLHYAVDRGHAEAVDLLLFCGANAFVKDSDGYSPISACQDPELKKILRESRIIIDAIQNNDIFLQHVELHSGQTYHLTQLDLTVHTNKNMGSDSLSFLCRRVRPEYSNERLHPANSRELLISDTFEFRLSGTRVDGTVELEVPLYTQPEPYEEIVMKTNEKPYVDDKNEVLDKVERVGHERKWLCRVILDLTKITVFVLLVRPKVEIFPVTNAAHKIRSKVDDFIRLDMERDTFTRTGNLCLEVIPSPMYKYEEYHNLESISYFYELQSSHKPEKNVQVTLPVPRDFDGECRLCVLCTKWSLGTFYQFCTGETKKPTPEESWEIIEEDAKEHGGKVSFKMNHFSICVPIEVRADTPMSEVRSITDELCIKASEGETYIVFFTMVKPLEKLNTFSVIIECTRPKKVRQRMDYWRNKHYREQRPRESLDHKTVSGMKYEIDLEAETQIQYSFDGKTLPLHFHPLRKNNQKFEVQLLEPISNPKVLIKIKEEEGTTFRKKDTIEPLEIFLTGYPLEASTHQVDNLGDTSYKGFTNDKLMRKLSEEMEDEWIKVCILLGLSYQTIDSVLQDNKTKDFTTKKFKLLLLWRDMTRYRYDLGVHDLLYALKRSGRDDLVQYLRKELLNWYEECKDENDAFYGWLKITINGPDVEQNEGSIEPLSNRFFLALIERGKDKLRRLGPFLKLSTPEMNLIFSDALLGNMENKLLKMFVTAREKHENKKTFLLHLLNGLSEETMNKDLEWVETSARHWSMRGINDMDEIAKSTIEDENFLTDVQNVLEDFDTERAKKNSEKSRHHKQILPPKLPKDRFNKKIQDGYSNQNIKMDGEKSSVVGHVTAEEPVVGHVTAEEPSFEEEPEHDGENSREHSDIWDQDNANKLIGEKEKTRRLEDGMTSVLALESFTKHSQASLKVSGLEESKHVETEGSETDYIATEVDVENRSNGKRPKYPQHQIRSDVNISGGIFGESSDTYVSMETKSEEKEKEENGRMEEGNERFSTSKSEDLLPISHDHHYDINEEIIDADANNLNEDTTKVEKEVSYDVEENKIRHGSQELREHKPQSQVKELDFQVKSTSVKEQIQNDNDSFNSEVDYDFFDDKPKHS